MAAASLVQPWAKKRTTARSRTAPASRGPRIHAVLPGDALPHPSPRGGLARGDSGPDPVDHLGWRLVDRAGVERRLRVVLDDELDGLGRVVVDDLRDQPQPHVDPRRHAAPPAGPRTRRRPP